MTAQVQADDALSADRYEQAVRRFAATVLEQGRDRYGEAHSPLFVDGLHAATLEPARWQYGDQSWVTSNFASQQSLMRLLDGLTGLTGEAKYRAAAEEAAAYMLEHVSAPNGLLYWGGHTAWDLAGNRPVGEWNVTAHEMKNHQPYYQLLWRVDPKRTGRLLESIWAGHIVDWERLDYNRHAPLDSPLEPRWDHAFDEDLEIPFQASGHNLSFANTAVSLIHSGTMLAALDEHQDALQWAERLVYRWQQGEHPETGLGGGQISYRKKDRARAVFGHVAPQINEATMIATYHRYARYHMLPLAQMQVGQALLERPEPFASAGRRFIEWALEDLKVYGERVYDPEIQAFQSMVTDGTVLDWRQATDGDGGYYLAHVDQLKPLAPDGRILWSYALAYRLGNNAAHWRMALETARVLGLGEFGEPDGTGRKFHLDESLDQTLNRHTADDDWRNISDIIYALLELHETTGDDAFLHLAARVGDHLLARQSDTGLFPRTGREYARTGDEIPLALLHLAAAIAGKRDALPSPVTDSRLFHVRYSGPLEPHQQKPGDPRTRDDLVFYGR